MSNEESSADEQVDAREAARIQPESEQGTDESVQHDQEEARARGLEAQGDGA